MADDTVRKASVATKRHQRPGVGGPGDRERRMELFVNSLSNHGIIYAACEDALIVYNTYRVWIEKYPEFRQQCAEAKRKSLAKLERASFKRAVEGWDEAVYGQGGFVGMRKKYSDTLAMFLLRSRNRAKYGDAQDVGDKIRGTNSEYRRPEELTREELVAIIERERIAKEAVERAAKSEETPPTEKKKKKSK
jgi:hypothetical protein